MDYPLGVIAIIEHEGRILLGKKKIIDEHFLSGEWHVPGGRVEPGEDLKPALVREMMEELGVPITVGDLLLEELRAHMNIRLFWYLCTSESQDFTAGDDITDIKFVPKEEVLAHCGPNTSTCLPKEIIDYFNHGIVPS